MCRGTVSYRRGRLARGAVYYHVGCDDDLFYHVFNSRGSREKRGPLLKRDLGLRQQQSSLHPDPPSPASPTAVPSSAQVTAHLPVPLTHRNRIVNPAPGHSVNLNAAALANPTRLLLYNEKHLHSRNTIRAGRESSRPHISAAGQGGGTLKGPACAAPWPSIRLCRGPGSSGRRRETRECCEILRYPPLRASPLLNFLFLPPDKTTPPLQVSFPFHRVYLEDFLRRNPPTPRLRLPPLPLVHPRKAPGSRRSAPGRPSLRSLYTPVPTSFHFTPFIKLFF